MEMPTSRSLAALAARLTFFVAGGLISGCASSPSGVSGPSHEAVTFESADGARLYGDLHRSGASNAPLVLLMHQGGSNARGEYGPIVPRLLGRGMDALAVDLRRGGDRFGSENRTVEALGHNDTLYCDVLPDVAAAVDAAREAADGRPIILWGSSYSGALAIRYAAEHPGHLRGVLAFSPASGGPLAACPPDAVADRLPLPVLVLRPTSEAAIPAVRAQLDVFGAAGHAIWVADPGTHGSSMLVADRVDGEGGGASGVEATWARVWDFVDRLGAS